MDIYQPLKRALLKRFFGGSSNQERAGFTLTELLVVIAIIAVLFTLQLPGLAGAKSRTRVAQCAGNLKQFTMILELYGSDNNNKLPQNSVSSGNWPWDLQAGTFTNLMKYGATRNMLHCPANPDQNIDAFWYYAGGTIHVTGYAMTFPNTPALFFTNINVSLIPQRFAFGPLILPPAQSSKRVLVADATISRSGQKNMTNRMANQYTGIVGGVLIPQRTSHLDGALPTGGNLGMLDGHVEWRKFNDMIVRNDSSAPFTTPEWWW